MSSRTGILIPYRAGDAHRTRAFDFVRQWYSGLHDAQIFIGHDDGPGRFNRARALNRASFAADEYGGIDVYLVVDADTFVDLDQARAAIDTARETQRLVHAFTEWRGLSPLGTTKIYEGQDPTTWTPVLLRQRAREVYYNAVSSALAVHKSTWNQTQGFDVGFQGWGYEDQAFYAAATTFTGVSLRVQGQAWHLFHPPARERTAAITKGSPNRGLRDRYHEAQGNPAAMRALINRQPSLPRPPVARL
jgi:hypothetical protein